MLRGENAARPTYVGMTAIPVGSNELVRCEHAVLGANCVQKTVPIGADRSGFVEPRLLEALDHPNIPEIREAQFDPQRDNAITFVMPWYPGGSVADALVNGRRFSLQETIDVIRGVADALEYLHTVRSHLHRDIKPSNILLGEGGRPGYLADFERASLRETSGDTPAIQITPFYMAPELAVTRRHTVRSDIFGIGTVLFEMLNGRFRWEDFDAASVERRILQGRRSVPDALVAPAAFAPHVPRQLVRLTRKAISIDPSSRYGSARELLVALNRAQTVDWRRGPGDGLDGEWVGTWPPFAPPRLQDRYRVVSRTLESGRDRGRLRVVAQIQRRGTLTWRGFGVAQLTADSDDVEAIRQFFSEVSASVSHRRAAR